jgi:deoxyhypusine synthase
MSAPENNSNAPPEEAKNAVLVPSDELPEGAQKVEEIDFNAFKGKPITVEDIMQGMSNMGFQASSLGKAVKIINKMVSKKAECMQWRPRLIHGKITQCISEAGAIPKQATKLLYSWATPPT